MLLSLAHIIQLLLVETDPGVPPSLVTLPPGKYSVTTDPSRSGSGGLDPLSVPLLPIIVAGGAAAVLALLVLLVLVAMILVIRCSRSAQRRKSASAAGEFMGKSQEHAPKLMLLSLQLLKHMTC